MSQDNRLELYELLKLKGFQLEQRLNERLQERANEEEFVQGANLKAQLHAAMISRLQGYVEILATQLNLPTKRDVANVARLTAQVEGKVDNMEDQLYRLAEAVESIEDMLDQQHRGGRS